MPNNLDECNEFPDSIEEALAELKKEFEPSKHGPYSHDVHIAFDTLTRMVTKKYEPELYAEICELTKDVDFWYE